MKQATINQAANHLRTGQLVIFPTETVYGLGADATNPRAVAKIFTVKKRPRFNPLIVHIAHPEQLPDVTSAPLSPEIKKIIAAFWPGPLTLVLPKSRHIPDLVTAGLPTVGVRIPDHPVALKLLARFGKPVAAPSANLFQKLSPTKFQHLDPSLKAKVACHLDGGPAQVGVESTILQIFPRFRILRVGGIPAEVLEDFLKRKIPLYRGKKILSSGLSKKHYAPRTPLFFRKRIPKADPQAGLLLFRAPQPTGEFKVVSVLSPRGNMEEAAATLFSKLHQLDQSGVKRIYALEVPRQGLGLAINDRLRRASQPR